MFLSVCIFSNQCSKNKGGKLNASSVMCVSAVPVCFIKCFYKCKTFQNTFLQNSTAQSNRSFSAVNALTSVFFLTSYAFVIILHIPRCRKEDRHQPYRYLTWPFPAQIPRIVLGNFRIPSFFIDFACSWVICFHMKVASLKVTVQCTSQVPQTAKQLFVDKVSICVKCGDVLRLFINNFIAHNLY